MELDQGIKCHVCGSQQTEILKTITTREDGIKERYRRCKKCDARFWTAEIFKRPVREQAEKPPKKVKPWKCPDCGITIETEKCLVCQAENAKA